LNAFQTDLAKEDVRFLERQNDLIERQKQEKDSIRQMFEDQLQQKKREFDDLQEDYSNATGELQSEKRRKMELESELNTIREGHKNEMIRMKQENDHYVQKLVKSMNTVSQVRLHSKNNSELTKALQAIKEQIETDSKLDNCIVCLTSRKDCVFQPCRDNVTCLRCAENLTNCPKCLQIIREKRPRQ
jgi:chromosome segregation ATPase